MKTQWIRVRHLDTGGETDIPERVRESYARRGWFPLADFDEAGQQAEPHPDTESDTTHTEEYL